ncbi:MAG: hydrolase [Desulfobacterales bacterium]|nr:hydrolase [Desulfobacterales bacterium]
MLDAQQTALVVIDVQGKLARTVSDSQQVVNNVEKLIRGANLFELPVVVTEQHPVGLGPTIEELQGLFSNVSMVEKMTFNACMTPYFVQTMEQTGRRKILICGVEAHICVHQTVYGLLGRGFQVHLASDAVSSRTAWNRNMAIERMRVQGAVISTTEMALFELMQDANDDRFREFARIVK